MNDELRPCRLCGEIIFVKRDRDGRGIALQKLKTVYTMRDGFPKAILAGLGTLADHAEICRGSEPDEEKEF